LTFFSTRLGAILPVELLFVFVAYCVSYIGFGVMFGIVTRYREDFVAERERAESLKVESAVLESISDCFISLDADFRGVYVNDASCTEFGVDRAAALGSRLDETAGDFFSAPMVDGLQAAFARRTATVFEAQNTRGDRWYEMRCFPRPDGLSIYFQNISARRPAEANIAHLACVDRSA
jgi:PAS domain-containing protein